MKYGILQVKCRTSWVSLVPGSVVFCSACKDANTSADSEWQTWLSGWRSWHLRQQKHLDRHGGTEKPVCPATNILLDICMCQREPRLNWGAKGGSGMPGNYGACEVVTHLKVSHTHTHTQSEPNARSSTAKQWGTYLNT